MSSPDLVFYSVVNIERIESNPSGNDTNLTVRWSSEECTLQYSAVVFYQVQKPLTILTSYIIPLIVIILSYARLLCFLRHRDKKMVNSEKISLSFFTKECDFLGSTIYNFPYSLKIKSKFYHVFHKLRLF